jgi:hypothetical protein
MWWQSLFRSTSLSKRCTSWDEDPPPSVYQRCTAASPRTFQTGLVQFIVQPTGVQNNSKCAEALRHEHMQGSEGTAPSILDFSTNFRRVVSFEHWPLCYWRRVLRGTFHLRYTIIYVTLRTRLVSFHFGYDPSLLLEVPGRNDLKEKPHFHSFTAEEHPVSWSERTPLREINVQNQRTQDGKELYLNPPWSLGEDS